MSRRATLVAACAALAVVAAGCGGKGGSDRQAGPGPALGSLAGSGAGHRFYEIYEPDATPRGTLLMVHGGGWTDHRGDARRMMATAAGLFRQQGWRVVDIAYSPGPRPDDRIDPRPMLRDVVAYYDQVKRAFGGPVCAYGESAGGHLTALLALERPSLTCAVLNAAPLDLPTMLRDAIPAAQRGLRHAFGTSRATLDAWSPGQLWGGGDDAVPVFATAADNDTTVPPNQLREFSAQNPDVDADVVDGAKAYTANSIKWMHSVVARDAITARLVQLGSWLDGIVPHDKGTAADRSDVGGGCATLPPAADRWQLLRSGDAWQPSSTKDLPIAATRGCSGSARWQDDGLSLWALPVKTGAPLPGGAESALTYAASRPISSLTARFRGFLASPREWVVGLYASKSTTGPVDTQVASCNRGTCSGLRAVQTSAGTLVAAEGSHGDPDAQATPPAQTFALPQGTRRVAWRMECVEPSGCSLAGVVDPSRTAGGQPLGVRARDPLGHPAILSVYSVAIR